MSDIWRYTQDVDGSLYDADEGEHVSYAAHVAEVQRLQEQIDEVEEYLPAATGPYQTLGERAKLLKDQMEYAAERYGEAVKRLAELELQP